jgi:hypothetical protein
MLLPNGEAFGSMSLPMSMLEMDAKVAIPTSLLQPLKPLHDWITRDLEQLNAVT